MFTVRWGKKIWTEGDGGDEDEMGPPSRWYSKDFDGDEMSAWWDAVVFFRKKDDDPNWDCVELLSDKTR